MNILKRTFVILVAALAIVGVLLAFSNSSLATKLNGQQQHNRHTQMQSDDANASSTTVERPRMGEHEGGESDGMGIVAVLSDLFIVGAIVVPVQLGALAIRRLKHREVLKPS